MGRQKKSDSTNLRLHVSLGWAKMLWRKEIEPRGKDAEWAQSRDAFNEMHGSYITLCCERIHVHGKTTNPPLRNNHHCLSESANSFVQFGKKQKFLKRVWSRAGLLQSAISGWQFSFCIFAFLLNHHRQSGYEIGKYINWFCAE